MSKINAMVIGDIDIKAKLVELRTKLNEIRVNQLTVQIKTKGNHGYAERHKGIIQYSHRPKNSLKLSQKNGKIISIKLNQVEDILEIKEIFNMYD